VEPQPKPFLSYTQLFLSLLLFGGAVSFLANALVGRTIAQSNSERVVEDTIPKQVPIKVKLKAEKEAKFKDLSNSNWLREFELEVTNISDKPIYFLELWLVLPDTKSENDNPLAFSLRYGRIDFIHFNTRPVATDVSIQPGETHTFTIPEGKQRGWQAFKLRRNAPDPGKVAIEFVHLSFGDGTGFDGGGEAYPYKRKQSSTGPCREGPKQTADKTYGKNARIAFPEVLHESRPGSIVTSVLGSLPPHHGCLGSQLAHLVNLPNRRLL
jgi:hypothetical protein